MSSVRSRGARKTVRLLKLPSSDNTIFLAIPPAASSAARSGAIMSTKRCEMRQRLRAFVLLSLGVAGAFAGTLRRTFKTHRQGPRAGLAAAIEGNQQRRLQVAQPQHQVRVKRRRERIVLIKRLLDPTPRLAQARVVDRHAHQP